MRDACLDPTPQTTDPIIPPVHQPKITRGSPGSASDTEKYAILLDCSVPPGVYDVPFQSFLLTPGQIVAPRVAGRSKEHFAELAFADAHPLGAASQSWTGIFRVVYSVRHGHLAICKDV